MKDDTKLLTPEELAEICGVSIGTVYQWNYKGTGPVARRIGKHVRYRRADVDTWIERQVIARGAA